VIALYLEKIKNTNDWEFKASSSIEMLKKYWKTHYYLKAFFVLYVLAAIGCAQETSIPTEMQGFESEVDSLMHLYHTVGTAVAIIKDDELVYANGFGYRDLENKIRVDKNTVFGIGSCSKAFTAALFGILEKEGKLSIKDKPSKYIDGLKFYTSDMDDKIQIKHILSHSTGIPQLSTESSAVFFRSDDKNAIIPRLKHLKPQSDIGEEWIYNNYLYALAGRVTEHVTTKSWQENLSELIFEPLEMKRTYGNVIPASKDPNFSFGYGVFDTIPKLAIPENFPTRDAGGDIYSNVEDLAKWLSVWMNKGFFKNKNLLPEAYIKHATGKQQLINTDSITQQSQYYGYGWMTSELEGHTKIEHSGGVSGYTSNMVFFPDDQLGIIVLSNQNTAGISFTITNNIIKRFLNIDIPAAPNEPFFSRMPVIENPNTNTVINTENPPSHSLEDMIGNYFHPGFGTITVTFTDNTLYAEFPFTKFRLEHQNNNLFYDYFTEQKSLVVGNFLRFDFQSNESGTIDKLLLNVDAPPTTFLKQ